MKKVEVIRQVKTLGYVIATQRYSYKTETDLWTIRACFNCDEGTLSYDGSRKILQDANLDALIDKAKAYFCDIATPIKILKVGSLKNAAKYAIADAEVIAEF